MDKPTDEQIILPAYRDVDMPANGEFPAHAKELSASQWLGERLSDGKLFAEGIATGVVLNPVNFVIDAFDFFAHKHIPRIEFADQHNVDRSIAGVAGEVVGTGLGALATGGAAALIKMPAVALSAFGEVASVAYAAGLTENVLDFRLSDSKHVDSRPLKAQGSSQAIF